MSSWSIGPVGGPRARSGLPGSRRVVSTWRVGRIVPLGPDRLRVVLALPPERVEAFVEEVSRLGAQPPPRPRAAARDGAVRAVVVLRVERP